MFYQVLNTLWLSAYGFRNFASAILNVKNIGNDTTLVSAYRDTSNGPSVLILGENTDVLVGFFPSSYNRKTFDGCMNQLRFDDELMGLWYWKVKILKMYVCMHFVKSVCIRSSSGPNEEKYRT